MNLPPPPPPPHIGDHGSSAPEKHANQSFLALLENLFLHPHPLSSPSSNTTATTPFFPLRTHKLLPRGRLRKRLRQFLEYLAGKVKEWEKLRDKPSPPPSGEAPPPSEDAPPLTPPPPPTPAAHPFMSLTQKLLAGAVGVALGLGLGIHLLRRMSES